MMDDAALGILTPALPGDVSLCGVLEPAAVDELLAAGRFASWLYLAEADNKANPAAAVRAAGAPYLNVPVIVSEGLSKDKADAVAAALAELPRPCLVQCASANRAGAALLLRLAELHGYNADAALQLGRDLGLKCCEGTSPDDDPEAPPANALVGWLRSALGTRRLCEAPPPACGAPAGLLLRQLFDDSEGGGAGSSTYTYLLADEASKDCVLIDPVLERVERDLALVDSLGLTLTHALNTHAHADHVTGTGAIKARLPSVKSVISEASQAKADLKVAHGDAIRFGRFELEVLATPGHTDGCVTFACGGMVFTGDALLVRGCGRTDFQQGDAGRLYEAVHAQLLDSLPPATAVFPAHDYKRRNVSTVREEALFNPRLSKAKDEFVSIMDNLGLPYPKLIDKAVPANMACGAQD